MSTNMRTTPMNPWGLPQPEGFYAPTVAHTLYKTLGPSAEYSDLTELDGAKGFRDLSPRGQESVAKFALELLGRADSSYNVQDYLGFCLDPRFKSCLEDLKESHLRFFADVMDAAAQTIARMDPDARDLSR
ncbi:hypothetical protein LZ32DRAFT_255368 [Colletotrichum eremochloae]|nr:hypothetical protein LZ32DRAFT_255368 [Colletotrichum eremochloae]